MEKKISIKMYKIKIKIKIKKQFKFIFKFFLKLLHFLKKKKFLIKK